MVTHEREYNIIDHIFLKGYHPSINQRSIVNMKTATGNASSVWTYKDSTYCYNIPIYDWNTSLESIWVITYGSASASATLLFQHNGRKSKTNSSF